MAVVRVCLSMGTGEATVEAPGAPPVRGYSLVISNLGRFEYFFSAKLHWSSPAFH